MCLCVCSFSRSFFLWVAPLVYPHPKTPETNRPCVLCGHMGKRRQVKENENEKPYEQEPPSLENDNLLGEEVGTKKRKPKLSIKSKHQPYPPPPIAKPHLRDMFTV